MIVLRGLVAACRLRWRAWRTGRTFAEQMEWERALHVARMTDAIEDASHRRVPLQDVLRERGML